MNDVQRTADWDERFRIGDVPWEDEILPRELEQFLAGRLAGVRRVLDAGCGFGTVARFLAAREKRRADAGL